MESWGASGLYCLPQCPVPSLKVAIVFHCRGIPADEKYHCRGIPADEKYHCRGIPADEKYTAEYYIFVVDLNRRGEGSGSGSCASPQFRFPTLRLDSNVFFNWNFCVIGSTLYAFETYDRRISFEGYEGRGIYKFDLPMDDEANLKLDISMLSMVCQMRSSKTQLTAIASPDGKKIVIFSKFFETFELFDPVQQSCFKLPPLPINCIPGLPLPSNHHRFRAESLIFISDNVFLLKTNMGNFTMDIGVRVICWKKLINFYGGVIPDIPYRVKGVDLCLTPSSAYSLIDLDCDSGWRGEGWMDFDKRYNSTFRSHYYYPDAAENSLEDYEYTISSITLLEELEEEQDGDFGFCIIKTGQKVDSKCVHVALDLFRCNLPQCREYLIRNREREEVDQWLKMNQINIWAEEMQIGRADIERSFEFVQKRNVLLGSRESLPLPGTMMVKSLQFSMAEQCESFFLYSFASIPTGHE